MSHTTRAALLLALTLFTAAHAASPFSSPANTVCKSFRVCSNARALAWASVDVFSAIEPVFDQLRLQPMSQYVSVVAADGVAGCECAQPVEVQISLPVNAGSPVDMLVSTLSEFVAGLTLPGAPCISPLVDVQCNDRAEVIAQRRRLAQALPFEVMPTELAPQEQEALSAQMPAPVMAMEASASEGSMMGAGSYGGYGYYGYGYYGYGSGAGMDHRSMLEADYQLPMDAAPLALPTVPLPVRYAAGGAAASGAAAQQQQVGGPYAPSQAALAGVIAAGAVAVALAATGTVLLVQYLLACREEAATGYMAM